MKYYLSSYEIGNEGRKLCELAHRGTIGYIPNARDFTGADPVRVKARDTRDREALHALGLQVTFLNLRDYFGKSHELEEKLRELGAIFISGGNVFVLRQAMRLCGLDDILKRMTGDEQFLYAGYSAAGCVLAPSLEGMDIVDPLDTPYEGQREIIWDGLGLLEYRFMPHWQSDHPESADIDREIEYCKQRHIPYKALRDGEVIVIE